MDLRPLQSCSFRELYYFVALAEELHLGRAGERVGIEESSLSRAITAMESKLQVRLFSRGGWPKGTQLSVEGEALLPIARRMLAEAANAKQAMQAAAAGRQGRLRVACCENVASPLIAELMRQSRAEDTDVDFSFEQRALPEQLVRLREGGLDVGLAASASDEPAGADTEVEALVLSRDAMVLAMPAEHAMAAWPVVQVLHESLEPIVLVDCCALDVRTIGPLIRPQGPPPRIELAPSLNMLLTRVAAGDGVGFISAVQAEAISRRDIAFRPLSFGQVRMTTYLLRRQGEDSPAAQRFMQRARRLHVRRS